MTSFSSSFMLSITALLLTVGTGFSSNVTTADVVSKQSNSARSFFDAKLDCLQRDGLVTRDEFATFLQVMDRKAEGDTAVPLYMAEPFFLRNDLDDDGYISWSEFAATYPRLVSGSDAPSQQIHLSITNETDEMRVMWSTSDANAPAQVQLNGADVFTGSSATYSVDTWTSLTIHTVTLTGLKPSTLYTYRVATGSGWGEALNFTSAPPSSERTSTWVVYGDMGTAIPFGYAVTDMIIAERAVKPFDLILHVGDIAYAGVNKDGEWEPTWAVFMNQIQPLASLTPYGTTVGNHENYYNYRSFNARFDMAPNDTAHGGPNHNFWFSFDYGTAHVTSFSTEHDYSFGSPQRAWIERDLADARARGVEWLFVSGHRPLYSSDADEYSSHRPGAPLLKYLEDLLVKYEVDMVLTGHMHEYERTFPTINGSVVGSFEDSHVYKSPKAPVYMVQGTAGALIFEKNIDPQPAWSAVRLQQYGYGVMELSPSDDPAFKSRLVYTFKGEGGAVYDSVTVYK